MKRPRKKPPASVAPLGPEEILEVLPGEPEPAAVSLDRVILATAATMPAEQVRFGTEKRQEGWSHSWEWAPPPLPAEPVGFAFPLARLRREDLEQERPVPEALVQETPVPAWE
ncbi:MAG: hypothetical protein KatS3mg112_0779 [Thermogutta sp.]|nr:MAG: hypothetical protein KatS3mg112_0779 [Thermogutta sp.]